MADVGLDVFGGGGVCGASGGFEGLVHLVYEHLFFETCVFGFLRVSTTVF